MWRWDPEAPFARLDEEAMERALDHAPLEVSQETPALLGLPLPGGTFACFGVVESPILGPDAAAELPEFRTFRGQGIHDASLTMRLSWSPAGLHAIVVRRGEPPFLVARPSDSDPSLYVSTAMNAGSMDVAEGGGEALQAPGSTSTHAPPGAISAASTGSFGSMLRMLRLAVAATGEYTRQFEQPGDDDPTRRQRALLNISAMVNNFNAIYEAELATRFELVTGTELIFTDAGCDPYDMDPDNDPNTIFSLGVLQKNNQDVMDCTATVDACGMPIFCLGSPGYDVGAIFAVTGHGGNAAGGACTPGTKAKVALGDGIPGNARDVGVAVHELGHQLGAAHTFNVNDSSARVPTSAFEPGGGTTIMSYAGISGCSTVDRSTCIDDTPCKHGTCVNNQCTGDATLHCTEDKHCTGFCYTPHSIQDDVDSYFHARSIQQMADATAGCGTLSPTGNGVPSVEAGPPHAIPSRTPFALTAEGSDPDGDPLTYCWEEFDLGEPSPPEADADGKARPLFRSYPPDQGGRIRLFPSLTYILNNANSPPANDPVTHKLIGEVLPTITRTMTFRVTVRDGRAGGAGIAWDETQIEVDGGSGPFAVTSPNSAVVWTAGSMQSVAWDVAGTDAPPVGCSEVAISLSTDGGASFPIPLAATTPNDGSEAILVPALSSDHARVKVECAGNIFFDLSDTDFVLNLPPELTCHDVSTSTDPGLCSAVIAYDTSATDDRPGVTVSCSPPEGSAFPRGNSLVECLATDSHGATDTCTFAVTVEDDEAPALSSVAADPAEIWPPSQRMVDTSISYLATDNCGSPTCVLSVASSEKEDGLWGGDESPDSVIVDEHHVLLRAERWPQGDGRTYTTTVSCTDTSGNGTASTAVTEVPHDQSGHASALSGFNASGTRLTRAARAYMVAVLSSRGFDATHVDAARIHVGNHLGKIDPIRISVTDVNCDGLQDISVAYPVEATRELMKRSGAHRLALRYETDERAAYIVEDIFGLGAPVAPAECHGSSPWRRKNGFTLRAPGRRQPAMEE